MKLVFVIYGPLKDIVTTQLPWAIHLARHLNLDWNELAIFFKAHGLAFPSMHFLALLS
jgi:hypothetical protein